MTITREPLYEDAPSGRLAALGRHVVAWFASIGQAVRLMAESFAYLPGTIFRRRGRGEFVSQPTYAECERGSNMRIGTLQKIVSALGEELSLHVLIADRDYNL